MKACTRASAVPFNIEIIFYRKELFKKHNALKYDLKFRQKMQLMLFLMFFRPFSK